jgi:hypothetical protein
MDPVVKLIKPWVDPQNSFRASSVEQMFDYHISTPTLIFDYFVGVEPVVKTFVMYIRNKTLNTDLNVSVELPDYFSCDTSLKVTVVKNTISLFVLRLNEPWIKEYTKTSSLPIRKDIIVTASPVDVVGPVYVRTDLKMLSESV